MTPERKVWTAVSCIIFTAIVIAIIVGINANTVAYAKSLSEAPYLIKGYGNGVYIIALNPEQYHSYEEEDSVALGLSEMKNKCTIISFKPLPPRNPGEYAILVTTNSTCEIATTPLQRRH